MSRMATARRFPAWATRVCLAVAIAASARAEDPADLSAWTIHIANDSCPDYTWGFPEAETRKAFAWSREVALPLAARLGKLRDGTSRRPPLRVDARRAVATCLKPVDRSSNGGVVLRVWETAGRLEPLAVGIAGTPRLWRTDLLERDLGELPLRDGGADLPLRGRRFAALRIAP